ncbi:hypothetical protein V2G26_021065 [Clonostachys chloroleuca]
MRSTAQTCDLCSMVLETVEHARYRPSGLIEFRQTGTGIGVQNGPDLISFYERPGSGDPNYSQYGLPILPKAGSKQEFALIKRWLHECDSHATCQKQASKNEGANAPTRLLEVGHNIRLVDASSIRSRPYIALSHCWGPLKPKEKFCTYQENIEVFRRSILFDDLPKTFQDAITVTRGIGISYLWIDSLCIIQNDKEEWKRESAKMQYVFSGAYCTLSVNSARSSLEGFLTPRVPRTCVPLPISDSRRLYVCPSIDDFHRDVDQSVLHTRGWVLQERALSRRFIHYTSTQVYWECGAGVQCESLAKFQNSRVAFLGDPKFPTLALQYYRDGRQILLQYLYETYSQLAFTNPTDRPVAILGLESRLSSALQTRAMFGTFSKYFPRFLLWESAELDGMRSIAFDKTDQRVPTWSWLSKLGAIRYMKLEFNNVDWATQNFESPFSSDENIREATPASSTMSASLRAYAQSFTLTQQEANFHISFDLGTTLPLDNLKCVIMGRDKSGAKVYAIIIKKSEHGLHEGTFERIGSASFRPAQVCDGGVWVLVC